MLRCLLLVFSLFSTVVCAQQTFYNVTPGDGYGLRFWNNDYYKIHMGNGPKYVYGPVSSYSIKSNMTLGSGSRGWTWGEHDQVPIAAMNTLGNFQIAGYFKSKLGIFEAENIQAAATATDWMSWSKYSLALAAGKVLETKSNGHEVRKLEFYDHPATAGGLPAGTSFNLRNDYNKVFMASSSFNLETRFHIADPEGQEIIKAGNFSANSSNNSSSESINWAHMLKAKSRLAIGTSVLFKPEHEFTVRGSGWFEREIITNSKIGIGVEMEDIPTDYKLAVNGKIIGEEIKVQLKDEWPDYVFDTSYNLPSLEEVALYIKEKGHLMNVPSAKDVENTGGINLGKMNAKLLEKIEELTLYVITLKKENDIHKTQLESSKEKYSQLEERLKKIEVLLDRK